MDASAQQLQAAVAAGDWDAVRLLLHPYLHWTDGERKTIRGRSKVLAMHQQAAHAPEPSSVELRDGQIYRWPA